MRYIIVDSLNTFFRSIHSAPKGAGTWAKVGLSIHIMLASVNSVVNRFGGDHVVFCTEGRSWRKDAYAPYKKNREAARAERTEVEVEEGKMFMEAFDSTIAFLRERTNCTVVNHPKAEADDLIARFIALHPDDEHVIISSDTDYYQLLSPTVTLFNGVTDEHHTIDGIFKKNGDRVIDKKTKQPKTIPNPSWLLFEKCMRGDSGDNVFSAYPGVREKGSKNKVGLREAFADKDKQGYAWNNLMLQRWVDHNNVEHRVVDDYRRNVSLIDLTAQPEDLKAAFDAAIRETVTPKSVGQVGMYFLKFCGKYELNRLSDNAQAFASWMSRAYTGVLNDSRETCN